ncbi:50S ribosomal protein L10 [Candidatus Microgenomates bacterium]|nr:50S ribosomal protein L10 [Candidatus Microgenomates bacterium]
MANTKKTTEVEALTDILTSSPHFALIKFDKTSHRALEQLRKDLRASKTKMRVVKNTLFEKTVDKLLGDKKELNELKTKVFPLKESTAIISLEGDYAAGLGAFFKFAKADKTVSFKFGILDNVVYLGPDLEKIAKLPGKDQLIAKLIGGLKAAPYQLTYNMKFSITKLTLTLKERAKQTS